MSGTGLPDTLMDTRPRLVFANQLRGLAALSVVVSHLIGAFWFDQAILAHSTATPPVSGSPPAVALLVSHPWFNPGPFGVGVFFLISGMVIPLSLSRHTRRSFLAARVLRIFPTAALALVIEIAVVHANAVHWGLPMPFGNGNIITNFLLVYDLVGRGSIDQVNWTLCIELKFYLLMALLAGPVQRGRLTPLFAVAVMIELANLAYAQAPPTVQAFAPLRMMSLESVFIIFMLIGVLFNYHWRGLLSAGRLLHCVIVMLVLFAISWLAGALQNDVWLLPRYYLEGLAVFAISYGLRRHATRVGVLDWLADISFPLYLTHMIVGVSALKWLMLDTGLSFPLALAVSVGATLLIATVLHLGIERRSTAWGSRLAVLPGAA